MKPISPILTRGERYLDAAHRYLQGRMDRASFRTRVLSWWAEDHDDLWALAWPASECVRREERDERAAGGAPRASLGDPRLLPRALDRLCRLCRNGGEEEPFRASLRELLTAYRDPEATGDEAEHVWHPPRVNLFERPLLGAGCHFYPCALADIGAQLALVPECDLLGLWAVGLTPAAREDSNAYGVYYRRGRGCGKPVIHLLSATTPWLMTLDGRAVHAIVKRHYRVEREYGLEMRRDGDRLLCAWPAESYRRFVAEHVLLHEIGHHVDYERRARAGFRRRLPTRAKEQFAEDYAIRFRRGRRF